MKRNPNDIRKTAVLAAAAAAGVTLWSAAAAASENRPADFETEFELELELPPDLPAPQPEREAQAFVDGEAPVAADEPVIIAAALDVAPVADECCAAIELVAPEATMSAWARAVSDYLDHHLARPTDSQDSIEERAAEAFATLASEQKASAASTTCEFCAKLLAELNDEQPAAEHAAYHADAEMIPVACPTDSFEWQVLANWTIARFAGVSRTMNAADAVPASDGGDTCFRLIVGDEQQVSTD